MVLPMPTILDVLTFLIEKGPGRTERELAQAIYGGSGKQQNVNQDCALLLGRGVVQKRGIGGPTDPYRYYPIDFDENSKP